MAATKNDVFTKQVLPIMNKVRDEMCSKCADEIEAKQRSFSFLAAGAAGPDGGMSSRDIQTDSLRILGKWNSKNVEDYVDAVKAELKKKGIRVTPELEKKMIDKMIKDRIPKNSIDYVIRKASQHTIFGLQNALNTSPLEEHLQSEAEKRYNPSKTEKVAGWALGTAVDIAATAGAGGWSGAAKYAATDAVMTAGIPLIIDPDKADEYKKDQEEKKKKAQEKPKEKPEAKEKPEETTEEKSEAPTQQEDEPQQEEQSSQTNDGEEQFSFGWDKLFQMLGTDGFSDIMKHPGTMLAMLPNVILGLFTGKTQSINMKDCAIPMASIAAGLFVKNPLLKMLLMGFGGVNLLNKAGHEVLSKQQERFGVKENLLEQNDNYKNNNTLYHDNSRSTTIFKHYDNEPLNPRILQPQLRGNYLIATIDGVPCSIALPQRVIEANLYGALPLNTLANAVLRRNDELKQIASEHYDSAHQKAEDRQQSSVLRQR